MFVNMPSGPSILLAMSNIDKNMHTNDIIRVMKQNNAAIISITTFVNIMKYVMKMFPGIYQCANIYLFSMI